MKRDILQTSRFTFYQLLRCTREFIKAAKSKYKTQNTMRNDITLQSHYVSLFTSKKMNYDNWEKSVPGSITEDSLWKMTA